MKQRIYQCCARCVMDTSDPEIRFDKSECVIIALNYQG